MKFLTDKKLFIGCFILSVLLCTLNIVLMLSYSWWDNIGLLATIVSGWVSGVATLCVGLIAFRQSKNYNDSNNRFIQKQYEIEQCKIIIQSRLMFVDNIAKAIDSFIIEADPLHLMTTIVTGLGLADNKIGKTQFSKNVTMYHSATVLRCLSLSKIIKLDTIEDDIKTTLLNGIIHFEDAYYDFFKNYKMPSSDDDVVELHKKVGVIHSKCYVPLFDALLKYKENRFLDINFSISSKNDDLNYLKSKYTIISKIE